MKSFMALTAKAAPAEGSCWDGASGVPCCGKELDFGLAEE